MIAQVMAKSFTAMVSAHSRDLEGLLEPMRLAFAVFALILSRD